MLPNDIKKKIKLIEIKTKKILNGLLIGNKNSSIKGSGLEFDQIRDYQQGDDIRFIDWKNSAKSNQLFVKQYFEERSRDVIIMFDISGSMKFGSSNFNKEDISKQIAIILSYVTAQAKDNLGLLLFSKVVEDFIQPRAAQLNLNVVIDKIINCKNTIEQTNFNNAINFLNAHIRNNAIIVLISDFIDQTINDKNLKILSSKHSLFALRCVDKLERSLPEIGIIQTIDIETGKEILIDLRKKNQKSVNNVLSSQTNEQNLSFKKSKIKYVDIDINKDCFLQIKSFFKETSSY